jgi:hypothetical protein
MKSQADYLTEIFLSLPENPTSADVLGAISKGIDAGIKIGLSLMDPAQRELVKDGGFLTQHQAE